MNRNGVPEYFILFLLALWLMSTFETMFWIGLTILGIFTVYICYGFIACLIFKPFKEGYIAAAAKEKKNQGS